ncbi:MAG: FAD-dependent oxidoreductase [Christensenellaceae bacterium]|nr:FAD-dependent oxidoreductase [Christensenellaceae bacterium]
MKTFIHEKPKPSQNPASAKHYDVVVVGGGMSGLCAAIASARHGAKTCLIQDRSVYGGNASSEIRMHISGASCHWGKKNAAETGILMELQLDNKKINDSYNYSIWDGVLWSKANSTENLDCYMNTTMHKVVATEGEIQSVECYQMPTEVRYLFTADVFIDATGNGSLGYFAGCEYRIGCGDSSEFNEKDAPKVANGDTMGNSLYFVACDMGKPVKFIKPDWAYTFDESFFKHRYHGDIVVYHDADDVVVLKPDDDYEDHSDQLVEKYDVESGYWWIELGGDWDDIIKSSEEIRWELYKTIYGVWDHIKNGGDHGAENYELVWVGNIPGMRESRRLVGEYMLTANDIYSNRIFDDAVAYGGWPMDEHTAGGFAAKGEIPSKVRSFSGLYTIPYGCFVAKGIKNLMMAGRNISATKLAMGSTRVMGTCAVGGQAVGTAAAMSSAKKCTPSEFGKKHIKELQQALLKDDCYIPGFKNEDENDLALSSLVTATSWKSGCEAENTINGISRNEEDKLNLWQSDGIRDGGETISFKLKDNYKISQVRITFDPNLSEERCISVSRAFIDKEPIGVAKELVKDYTVVAYLGEKQVWIKNIRDNYQRQNILDIESEVVADRIEIQVKSTNGDLDAKIFEVRIY